MIPRRNSRRNSRKTRETDGITYDALPIVFSCEPIEHGEIDEELFETISGGENEQI